jgi:hypothetical protein
MVQLTRNNSAIRTSTFAAGASADAKAIIGALDKFDWLDFDALAHPNGYVTGFMHNPSKTMLPKADFAKLHDLPIEELKALEIAEIGKDFKFSLRNKEEGSKEYGVFMNIVNKPLDGSTTYLFNLQAGHSTNVGIPLTLRSAAAGDKKIYQKVLNMHQIGISLSTNNAAHIKAINQLETLLGANFENLPDGSYALPLGLQVSLLGLTFAIDGNGDMITTGHDRVTGESNGKNVSPLYNFRGIDFKLRAGMVEDFISAPATRVATKIADPKAAFAALYGKLGVAVDLDAAFTGSKPADVISGSRGDAPPAEEQTITAIPVMDLKNALKAAGITIKPSLLSPVLKLGYSVEDIVGMMKDDEMTIEEIVKMHADDNA